MARSLAIDQSMVGSTIMSDQGTALRTAVQRQELALQYQPMVDLHSNTAFGVEALWHWPHAQHGSVSAAQLSAMVEDTDLLVPIGTWMMKSACAQAKAWQDQGTTPLTVSVNLSTGQFWQPDLVDQLRHILTETELAPSDVLLEIAEPALMGDFNAVNSVLIALKALGVQLGLDNFGSGHSSLSYLKRFPLDWLKLDRSFLRDLITSPDDAAIVTSVISLAHSLGLKIMAVGVETESQLAFLRQQQCDAAQGYYFGAGLPVDSTTAWLQRFKPAALAPESTVRSVLVVDDDEAITLLLQIQLERAGYTVVTAATAEQGLGQLAQQPFGVLIADYSLPGMSGVKFLRRARAIYPDTVRLMLSARADKRALAEAINEGGIFQFLAKPIDEERLLNVMSEAFATRDSFTKMHGL